MKALKALITAAAACVCMLSCSLTCFAEGEDENYAVTTTTGTSAEGQGGMVWTQITKDTTPADNDSVRADVVVSAVENKKFTAKLQLITKQTISVFSGSMSYDPAHFKLVGSKLEETAQGELNETKEDGKYSFTYAQPQGTSFSGDYITLEFEMLGEEDKSDVIYLTIDSMLDMASQSLNVNKSDGIVNPSDAPKISLDVKTVRLAAFTSPYTFEQLGFADAINCEMDESGVAKYSEGGILAVSPGTVNASIIMKDYSKQKIRIEVYNTNASGDEIVPSSETPKSEKKDNKLIPAKKSVNFGVPVLLIAALAFAVYIVTKSMDRQMRERHSRPERAEQGSYEPRYQQRPYRSAYEPSRRPPRASEQRYPEQRPLSDRPYRSRPHYDRPRSDRDPYGRERPNRPR